MEHMGFPAKSITWTKNIMWSGTYAVLLNRIPGTVFHCKKGVRQRDHLSPLLFVLAAKLLQLIVNHAKNIGLLQLPISAGIHFRRPNHSICWWYFTDYGGIPNAADCTEGTSSTHADSTSLKVNYAKSHIVPINVSIEKLNHLAASFQCQGALPFTYLGLPLSIYKPTIQECLPLVHKVERRLINTSIFLGQGGKLQLVNSVLSSLPTFYVFNRSASWDNRVDWSI
jgi:hypothetical protein